MIGGAIEEGKISMADIDLGGTASHLALIFALLGNLWENINYFDSWEDCPHHDRVTFC